TRSRNMCNSDLPVPVSGHTISTVSRDSGVRLLHQHDVCPQYPCPTKGPAKFDHQALLPYRNKDISDHHTEVLRPPPAQD
ncbi:8998_t:CDS:2, partial [Cetraspora pellucida]